MSDAAPAPPAPSVDDAALAHLPPALRAAALRAAAARAASGLAPEVLARSVAELEALDVPAGSYGLGSVAWLARALVSPLGELGPAELRLLLGHGRGVRWLLPLALARLAAEPFVAGDRGAGDLLSAVLMLDPAAFDADARTRLAQVVHGARATLDTLPADDRARMADELDAAREQFGV